MLTVSVVIPAFNAERFLASTIRTALEQTTAAHEVIVVDDGSTDSTPEIAASFGSAITLVRLRENCGVLLATLEGLSRASADVVCFLDADDHWAPDKIAEVLRAFEEHPAAVLVSHDYRFVDAEGCVLRVDDPSQRALRQLTRERRWEQVSDRMLRSILEYRGEVWLGSAYSLRLSAVDRGRLREWVGGLPNSKLVYQDHPLATFVLVTAGGIATYIDRKLLDYRIHDENFSGAPLDPVRAKRIAAMGAATRHATMDLVAHVGGRDALLVTQARCVAEGDYLHALYEGRIRHAMRLYLECARRRWPFRIIAKEALRLTMVSIVGLDFFLRAKRLKGRILVAYRRSAAS